MLDLFENVRVEACEDSVVSTEAGEPNQPIIYGRRRRRRRPFILGGGGVRRRGKKSRYFSSKSELVSGHRNRML